MIAAALIDWPEREPTRFERAFSRAARSGRIDTSRIRTASEMERALDEGVDFRAEELRTRVLRHRAELAALRLVQRDVYDRRAVSCGFDRDVLPRELAAFEVRQLIKAGS